MGYTGAMFFASIVLAPIVLLVAFPIVLLARRLGLMPTGFGSFIGYAMVVCAGYALLYLYTTVSMLVVWPANLQKKYIGEQVGGPFSLTFYNHSGFQDPGDEWHYRVPPENLAELRKRCKQTYVRAGRTGCVLYGAMDERWYADVFLENGELHMLDGLH